jgi:hypothetical protein
MSGDDAKISTRVMNEVTINILKHLVERQGEHGTMLFCFGC